MNKLYTSALAAVLIGGTALAQNTARPERQLHKAHCPPAHGQAPVVDGNRAIIWQDDFSNPSNWTIAHDGSFDADFEIGVGLASTGDYPTPAIVSSTADNGYAMYDSDVHGNTSTTYERPHITTASPIDLTGHSNVVLSFQTQYRRYTDEQTFVLVSTDGTFPDIQTPDDDISAMPGVFYVWEPGELTTSISPGNPTIRQFNISAVAGNAPQVWVRILFVGIYGYTWYVDDINIYDQEQYDVAMTGAGLTKWDYTTALSYDSMRYSIYPTSQLRPIPLNMSLSNNGLQDLTDIVANFNVEQNGTTVFDHDQTIALASGENTTVFVNTPFTPPATIGTYNVTFSDTVLTGDASEGNDSKTATFDVSDFTYARDLNTITGWEEGDSEGAYQLCNGFHVLNATDLYAVDVALLNSPGDSPVDLPVTGQLWTADLTTQIAETNEHILEAGDFNDADGSHFISLIFSEAQPLDPATDYVVCIYWLGGDTLRTGTHGTSEPQTSFIYYNGQNGEDWYYTTRTPMVRMNFNATVGIDENRQNGVGVGQNLPNPSNTSTIVPFDLAKTANVSIEVCDLNGKLVRTLALGKKAAGVYRQELSTADLTEGVYTYSVVADGTRMTKRMVVLH